MQAVPSLVGTGTVVAAAAAGLVFGQPDDELTPLQPTSKRKTRSIYHNPLRGSPASSRPATSSAAAAFHGPAIAEGLGNTTTPGQQSLQPAPIITPAHTARVPRSTTAAQIAPPTRAPSSRRHSLIRPGDWGPPPISEVSRDSVSSNGSWIRRLSIRPLSQHGSPRSSVCPDSPSITFSHGSAAPILSPSATPQQLPRNKLVKRTTATPPAAAGADGGIGALPRRGSRSQMPTLRRPATSHQRSATLQQLPYTDSPPVPAIDPKYSLDQQVSAGTGTPRSQTQNHPAAAQEPAKSWTSFFHTRLTRFSNRGNSPRADENSPSNQPLPNRRIHHVRQGSVPQAYLISPAMMAAPPQHQPPVQDSAVEDQEVPGAKQGDAKPGDAGAANSSPEMTPSRRARRSISMHFSSPGGWISRNGSLRRQKRGSENKAGGKRHVSDPLGNSQDVAVQQQGDIRRAMEDIFTPPASEQQRQQELGALALSGSDLRTRKRNSSSPLPPLSRLSSFNVDISRLGVSSSSGPKSGYTPQSYSFSSSQSYPFPPHSRDVSNERSSTFAGSSDLDTRGFTSGDDDDTDFKSDTMFDSVRTTGSARMRAVETPLESMFDESPPSTAGNSKTKRLSIQEILGRSWDGDTRIMEEDEGVPTPIRGAQSSRVDIQFGASSCDPAAISIELERPSVDVSRPSRDYGRLSLDDDDEEDWARMVDENGLTNHLSPPSSSVNSRGASPNLRMALASISGNGTPESFHHDTASERPRSTLWDWSEPAIPDKVEKDGQSPRPKTVHGKQEMDLRGGRPTHRKGPTAIHVRSQSVPVIADPSDSAKPATSKFGTWASGPKNASEDWDDDFEFETSSGATAQGKDSATSFSMVVPPSIQATQPTVRAHSGQIRELSLLVNGLKRLCRHGRDLDILHESASLWKEAENIIALASPDEEVESAEVEDKSDRESIEFDPRGVDERFLEEGFDVTESYGGLEDPFDIAEPDMAKTAVVRERQIVKRRSVFSPDDDIFGGSWPLVDENAKPKRPETPDRSKAVDTPDSAMIASIMEAMQQQRSSSAPIKGSPVKPSKAELFFNTNTLQELVKRANTLFHNLSELVRRAELITQSPACTPRHDRSLHQRRDGSPAFTRVFVEPPSTPPKLLPKSHSSNSVLSRTSADSRASNGISQRMQLMTVS